MTERLRRAGQVSWAMVGVAVLVAIVGVAIWYVRVVLPPLILAGAIVFLLNPIVSWLQGRGVPRAAGAALAYLGVLAVLALSVVSVIPLASDQIGDLESDWPRIQNRIENWIDARAADLAGTPLEFTRSELEDAVSGNTGTLSDQFDQLREVGLQVFHVLLILVLSPIIAFYLLVDTPHLRRVSESLVPPAAKGEVLHVCRRLNRAIGGFFRGQLMVAIIVGVASSIGLLIIGLRFWFIVGMIAGLFNLIPLIGPWIGGIPGVIIALTTGSLLQALGVVIVMIAVQQIDNHAITPYVMQRAVQLHPAAVVLALLAGGSLFGFLGLLLAVPLAASLKIVLGHLWRVHILGEPWELAAAEQEVADIQPPGEGGPVEEVASRPENQGVA